MITHFNFNMNQRIRFISHLINLDPDKPLKFGLALKLCIPIKQSWLVIVK